MAFTPETPTETRDVEITWNDQGEATIKFTEVVDGRELVTTQYGWIEPNDPDLSTGVPESKLTVKLGRVVGHQRGLFEQRP